MSKKLQDLELSNGQVPQDEEKDQAQKEELLEVLAEHAEEEKTEDKKVADKATAKPEQKQPKVLNQFDQKLADIFKNRPKQK